MDQTFWRGSTSQYCWNATGQLHKDWNGNCLTPSWVGEKGLVLNTWCGSPFTVHAAAHAGGFCLPPLQSGEQRQRDPVTSFVLITWCWPLHSYSTTVWRHELDTSTDAVHEHEHFCTELFLFQKRRGNSRLGLFYDASCYSCEDAQKSVLVGLCYE